MESFIEINAETVIHFQDWIYDAILNRTIKEFEDNLLIEFVDFANIGKREINGYISLLELDYISFKIFSCNNLYKVSQISLKSFINLPTNLLFISILLIKSGVV